MFFKKLIIITSPPACGKTTLAKKLSRALGETAYIDKDAFNPFGKQICRLSGEEYNPDSEFFRRNVRHIEYEVTLEMAFETLEYSSTVVVNGPFGREIRDNDYMRGLRDRAAALGARLYVVFIEGTPEICRERMIKRNCARDLWKFDNWEEYIKGVNFEPPYALADVVELFIYRNGTDRDEAQSFSELIEFLEKDIKKI